MRLMENHDLASRPIIIGGVGGSGTRVVAQLVHMMNIHIGACLNHANDNRWFAMLFRRQEWAQQAPKDDVIRALDLFARASIRGLNQGITPEDIELINHCYSHWALSQNKPDIAQNARTQLLASNPINFEDYNGWGWKEPNSHIFIPEIAHFFPDARYILLVRNGFDMAYSRNQLQLKHWGGRFGINVDNKTNISREMSLDYWIEANAKARQNLDQFMPGRWLEIRFENLIFEPIKQIKRIANFINFNAEPEQIEQMSRIIEVPKSLGRGRLNDLKLFRKDQINAVHALGFTSELEKELCI